MPTQLPLWRELPRRDLIAFDFDGVLHEHRGYRLKYGKINVAPLLMAQRRGYATAVMTCNDVPRVAAALRKLGLRCLADTQMKYMDWYGGKDGRLVLVTGRKVAAKAYVDDRAIHWTYGDRLFDIFDTLDYRSGYKVCEKARHWGPHGGAGIVPFAIHNDAAWVLLGQRSKHVHSPGTWGGFGGAIDRTDKDAWEAAKRECFEEAHITPSYSLAEAVWECECGWTYTTFLCEVPSSTSPKVTWESRWECDKLEWVRWTAVADYDLHPGMANVWPQLKGIIDRHLATIAGLADGPAPAVVVEAEPLADDDDFSDLLEEEGCDGCTSDDLCGFCQAYLDSQAVDDLTPRSARRP